MKTGMHILLFSIVDDQNRDIDEKNGYEGYSDPESSMVDVRLGHESFVSMTMHWCFFKYDNQYKK